MSLGLFPNQKMCLNLSLVGYFEEFLRMDVFLSMHVKLRIVLQDKLVIDFVTRFYSHDGGQPRPQGWGWLWPDPAVWQHPGQDSIQLCRAW